MNATWGCFERIYYCSGSAQLDHNLRVISDYAERELKQDPERDPCLIEGWDEERLTKIIAEQRGGGSGQGEENGPQAAAPDNDHRR